MHGDHLKTAQILRNLLSNAIKYTDEGNITLNVIILERKNKHDLLVQFIITDTGIGIKEEDREVIFKIGTRAIAYHKNNNAGLGLGLRLVKAHVETLEGKFDFTSDPGKWYRI